MSSKVLVIVESPVKAKTIQKYLSKIDRSKTFIVEASYGHIRDLEKKKLGIDLSNFTVEYTSDDTKREVVQKLSKLASQSSFVYLATDNDREGESIAWHLKEALKLPKKKYSRIVFNEITESALAHAIKQPLDIDQDLVEAQQTRRIIDRIMGFKLSPLLWSRFKTENGNALSAGRVQSAVLNIIVNKERDIENHDPEPYWSLLGDFVLPKSVHEAPIEAKMYDTKKNTIAHFDSLRKTRDFLAKMDSHYDVVSKTLKESKESPDAPFITSTLQQEAYNKLGFSVKMTMQVAQKLYESGYITYMRTDSFALSQDAMTDIKNEVVKQFSLDMYEMRDYTKSKKIRNSQQAHEAIRPTRMSRKPDTLKDPTHKKLYDLIYKRTIASQMVQCIYSVLDLVIQNKHMQGLRSNPYEFRGKVSVVKSPGWKMVYDEKPGDVKALKKTYDSITSIKVQKVQGINTWTSAPGRYNESSIVKFLEREGIGRPSTFAGILEKLYQKAYIIVQDSQGTEVESTNLVLQNGKIKEMKTINTINVEKSRLFPTAVGIEINQYLEEYFGDLIDTEFTSQMEEQLDKIAEKDKDWKNVLNLFWARLKPRVEEAMKMTKKEDKIVLTAEKTEFTVGKKRFIVRLGKYGPLVEDIELSKGSPGKFISLKSYLKLVRKPYTEIDQHDIELLSSIPKTIKGTNAVLNYGRFGFYMKIEDESYMIPQSWVNKVLGGWSNIGTLNAKHVEELVRMKKEYLAKKQLKSGIDSSKPKRVARKNKDKYDPVKRKTMRKNT